MESPIEQLVPPVVIISACGLLCMAQFARYTAIIGRARQFHREYLTAYGRLRHAEAQDRPLFQATCEELERQAHGVLGLARLIRMALLFLVVAVMCMIVTSLFIGLEWVLPSVASSAAVAVFIFGLLMMLIGMGYVFAEVRVSLRLVEHEHSELETRAVVAMPMMDEPHMTDPERNST